MKVFFRYSLLLLVPFVFSSCFKEDEVAPTITLLGGKLLSLPLRTPYFELGYTAEDDRDGDISYLVKSTGFVNPDSAGIYQIQYLVKDASGNFSDSIQRTIVYYILSTHLEGVYTVNEKCYSSTGVKDSTFFMRLMPDSSNLRNLVLKGIPLLPDSTAIASITGRTGQEISFSSATTDTSYLGNGEIDAYASRINLTIRRVTPTATDSCTLQLIK